MALSENELARLIGTPFVYGGRGPDHFDCYGLLKHLYRRDGIELPDYLSPSDGARISALMLGELRLWQQIPEPEYGAAVLIRLPGNMHCGYCLDNGYFIHTWERHGGVIVERLSGWRHRIVGFYRYVGE